MDKMETKMMRVHMEESARGEMGKKDFACRWRDGEES